ncbi:MAG: tRNA uridine-5-carboxymethylaminomethyl(34) synthesis GTPase MnmE [Pseudomonadota bacterium]
MDTIFARSTAPGRAGVSVLRASGPLAWDLVSAVTRRPLPEPRVLALRKIWCSEELIDIGMVVLFPDGQSFTGEKVAEFHLHGSEAVVRRVLTEFAATPRARMAGPGEFTHRALINDKMDLAAVEGLGALLVAETEAQRRQAVRVLDGALRGLADAWRDALIRALAVIEVSVDFADEEVPQEVTADLADRLQRLSEEMDRERKGVAAASQIARGFEVAIVGAPNVGKSTLLNRLAGRPAALTSEIAGTTRDVLEVRIEIAGQLITLLDTAGLRDATDQVERAGVERAMERALAADLRVFVDEVPDGVSAKPGDLLINGKADLREEPSGVLSVSGLTGAGVDDLVQEIGKVLGERVASAGVALTDRQAAALQSASEALEEAGNMLRTAPDHVELVSALVRHAVGALDEVVGRIGVEDVLGEIFSQFCIGK